MKKMLLLVLLGWMVFPPHAVQAQNPPWFLVMEEQVAPWGVKQFMEAQQEVVAKWEKYGFDVPVFAYQNDENSFYWVIQLRNFGSLDTLYNKMRLVTELMRSDGFDNRMVFRDLSSVNHMVMMWVPRLSYHPNDEFAQSTGRAYVEWSFIYLLAGHEEEAAAALGAYLDFFAENRLDASWDVFRVLLGNGTPAFLMMTRAENPAVLRTRENIYYNHFRDDFNRLWNDLSVHVRKIENRKGWFMPSLSNLPERNR